MTIPVLGVSWDGVSAEATLRAALPAGELPRTALRLYGVTEGCVPPGLSCFRVVGAAWSCPSAMSNASGILTIPRTTVTPRRRSLVGSSPRKQTSINYSLSATSNASGIHYV